MGDGMKSGPIRALVAVGLGGNAVIMAHDSHWLAFDIEGISDDAEDVGLIGNREHAGIYLWEGTGQKIGFHSVGDGTYEPTIQYDGRLRPVLPGELEGLLAMEPPCEAEGVTPQR